MFDQLHPAQIGVRYNKAALVEQMEDGNIVSAANHVGKRGYDPRNGNNDL
jgi:hypothetical protein